MCSHGADRGCAVRGRRADYDRGGLRPYEEALAGESRRRRIYVHGGGWQTVRVVEMLEKDLQVPVVHAQACNAWKIHKHLMIRETMPGYGRLMAELP